MNTQAPYAYLGAIEAAARELSLSHEPGSPRARPVPVWANLEQTGKWLDRARARCVDPDPDFAGAAEWLLDNDYLVRRAIRQLKKDMPASFYQRLASLPAEGGLPRVFALAHGMLGASRLQLSYVGAVQFLRTYQEHAPLSIAELWALPTMLRLASLEIIVGAFGRLVPDLKPPFAISGLATVLDGYDATECVSRSLANLGEIAGIRWNDFFDATSLVEAALANDPSEVYALMDFDSRDRYRKAIEEIALAAHGSEVEIAEQAVQAAKRAGDDPRAGHVGYWLVDDGRSSFEGEVGCPVGIGSRLRRFAERHSAALYATALVAGGLAGLVVPVAYLIASGAGALSVLLGVALSFVPASVLSVTFVHWLIPLFIRPRILPKLDFDEGIAADCITAVAVPVILDSPEAAARIAEQLEMHWLTNPDPALRFVLLSDLTDAPEQRMPQDDEVEEALVLAIRQLNERHQGASGETPFFLLHRARQFNGADGYWMGWERKRGKIEQFNRLILENDLDPFPVREGDVERLRDARFVITLDADTVLPPGAAARLAGTLAHPLNQPAFEGESNTLRSGFAIVQPRIDVTPQTGAQTTFARLYSGDTAIDIYSRAVSDVYQDLFGGGIYVGKGIYDVRAFERCLRNRAPENALVSHDLFEGLHGRAALATDIVLYESFPTNYVGYVQRLHRWVRGDWQLLPWLGNSVPGANGQAMPSIFSPIARWQIVDNLRRSLISPTILLLIVAGWVILPGSAWAWTALALAAPGGYLVLDLTRSLARGYRPGVLQNLLGQLAERSGRWLLAIVFLVSDSFVTLDAICRTLWRVFWSRRHLLDWTSADEVSRKLASTAPRLAAWRAMWPSSLFAFVLIALLFVFEADNALAALPLLVVWMLAPEIAAWTARERVPHREHLSDEQAAFLRRTARRTWLYFETYAGPEDNWLPPDNVQEVPNSDVAHRTSPTNIGMFLLAAQSASDFGFVGLNDFSLRVRNAFDTMDRMSTYRGHLLNWYDTTTLAPLEPRYISMVDSGNLAVCLVALRQGLISAADGPVVTSALWDGLTVTFELLVGALRGLPRKNTAAIIAVADGLGAEIAATREIPAEWRRTLERIAGRAWPELETMIAEALKDPDPSAANRFAEVRIWLERVSHHLTDMKRDIDTMLPWLGLLDDTPEPCRTLAGNLASQLTADGSLADARERCARARKMVADHEIDEEQGKGAQEWLTNMAAAIASGARAQDELRRALIDLAERADQRAFAMEFGFLYDREARLFHIGYNLTADRLDHNHYDLLATEARLASYFAIAKRDVPNEHWFFLGRPITRLAGAPALLSWNGSMFEYLMPPLLMRSGANTLIGQSEWAAIETQRRYGKRLGVPWGISESGFAATDAEHHYQYRAFGVPALGFRRGLSRDLVVAPYASALALCARPVEAAANLWRLEKLGATGVYGFIEALDFTPERVLPGQRFSPVRSYMAHHQGMALVAVGNALSGDVMVERFHRDPRMRAIELLLQERIPWEPAGETGRGEEQRAPEVERISVAAPGPWTPAEFAKVPQLHLLGNGRLATWITDSGGGGTWWRQHALTRWHADPTRDDYGQWLYLRDTTSGKLWSAGRQPTETTTEQYNVTYHQHMVEIHRRDNGIGCRTEVFVAPFDDVEIRRVTIVNETNKPRVIEVTSYSEVVLAPALDDERHPAFSKLSVESTFMSAHNGLVFARRPRSPGQSDPVMLHCVVAEDENIGFHGYETDRGAFVGRNGNMRRPAGPIEGLTGTTGWTLDPVASLQVRVRLGPRETCQFAFLTIAGASRANVIETAGRYATLSSLDWAMADASQDAFREIRRLGLPAERLPELQALCSVVAQPHRALRSVPPGVAGEIPGQPRLWSFGISGDLPIVLLRLGDHNGTDLLETLVRAHRLWHRRGLSVDLVILRMGVTGYEEPVREQVLTLLREVEAHDVLGRRGGVHLLFADQIAPQDRNLLEFVARAVLDDHAPSLGAALSQVLEPWTPAPRFTPSHPSWAPIEAPLERPHDLLFDNGYGGFTPDGREYLIFLDGGMHTPAPWCNVLANEEFGAIVTEAGGGFTWSVNSGEHRLTPWANDPVADTPGEVLYLRDEASAEVWSPTPGPAGSDTPTEIRHGAGYSKWKKRSHGLEQEMLVFVPRDAPVKIVRLRLTNPGSEARRVTATYYAEWVLGAMESVSRPFVLTEYDAASHALLATNPWNPEFAGRVAFLTSSRPPHSLTTDRYDFLGPEGIPARPAALERWDLGGKVTPGGDACAAYQVHLDIAAGGTEELVFVLGEGANRTDAAALIERWRDLEESDRALAELDAYWDGLLGAIEVKTPDAGFDLMVNRWLLYQTMSSRVLARAGYYQAGGAFGFRDQLQDVLALLHADPARVRRQILLAAARQFEEGDVQHWWHPPSGRGVRTHCSDDFLWLPFVTARYIAATGDSAILDEEVPFLSAPPLGPEEDDRYGLFETAPALGLFDHCLRAIERGMPRGAHGLPLMGSGDWNDGMNRVGVGGRGESVWLGWFEIATMNAFAPIAEKRGRPDLAERWAADSKALADAIEASAWDGQWYVRAFDDGGVPWGSQTSDECRIDSLAQSWSILSGVRPPHSVQAMGSAMRELISDEQRIVRLLWPPFHDTPRDPGYIKAYPPGIRENGGQYTHAAAWFGLAFARMGDGDNAFRIFDIINPITHASTMQEADIYRREPYSVVADIGGVEPHVGLGGWSWYTGAASWTYQLGVSGILGIRLVPGGVTINPALPRDWGRVEVLLKGNKGDIHLTVEDPHHLGRGRVKLTVDGKPARSAVVKFPARGRTREVVVRLHREETTSS